MSNGVMAPLGANLLAIQRDLGFLPRPEDGVLAMLDSKQGLSRRNVLETAGINDDPLVMGDGIAPTQDPVLLFRSPCHGVWFSKRLQDL